jgi:hypothetical protein
MFGFPQRISFALRSFCYDPARFGVPCAANRLCLNGLADLNHDRISLFGPVWHTQHRRNAAIPRVYRLKTLKGEG